MSDTKDNTKSDTTLDIPAPRPRQLNLSPEKIATQSTDKLIPGKRKTVRELKKTQQAKIRRISKKLENLEKEKMYAKQNLFSAKQAKKNIEDLAAGRAESGIITDKEFKAMTPSIVKAIKEDEKVAFKPNPGPQTEFLAASEKEVLYGGARGGGKSYAMLIDPLRYFSNGNARALLLRRTMPEVRDLIHKSKVLYPQAFGPRTKWREQEKEWIFPSGARMEFGYCESRDDVMRYQGQAYTWIGIDELAQFPTEDIVNDLSGSLRSIDPTIPTHMRFTANPGGPGHCIPFGDVLTANGWQDIKSVKVGDSVLTVSKTGQLFYADVTATVKEHYDGLMVKRLGRGLHLEFTENHRLPTATKNGIEIRPFYELPGQVNIVRAGNEFIGNEIAAFSVPIIKTRKTKLQQPTTLNYSDYAELMGWFLSEGHTLDRDKEFGISQIKEPQRTHIKALLDRCGFNYRTSKTGFQVSCASWYNYLKQFGKCRDKYVPTELLNSTSLRPLFNSLMAGDGTWEIPEQSGTYTTISHKLGQQVSEIAIKLGYSVYTSTRQRKDRTGLTYELSFSSRKTTELNTGNHVYDVSTVSTNVNVVKEKFSGEVYCLTVPETETFFVRQNGCVWLSGNTWVKRRFIDPAPPNTSFNIEVATPVGIKKISRRYIPAKLSDNPYLMQSDDYMVALANLPEHKRKQWLEGDWDTTEGAAFPEFDRKYHVVEPFEVPRTWPRFRAADWGYSSPACVLWFAVDYDNNLYVYREYYGKGLDAERFANKIVEMEALDPKPITGIMDSSLWAKRGDSGPSIIETMAKRGCKWRPSDRSPGSRVSGKLELHRRLRVENEQSKLKIFSTCTNLISTLPTLPVDPTHMEDVDTKAEDHAYDALRYGVMSRPLNASASAVWSFSSTNRTYKPADPVFGY